MSAVLVTGGSGFVGSHIILQLLEAGQVVRTTVRSPQREAGVRAMLEGAGAKPGDRLSFFAADLERDDGWGEALAGMRLESNAAAQCAECRCQPAVTRAGMAAAALSTCSWRVQPTASGDHTSGCRSSAGLAGGGIFAVASSVEVVDGAGKLGQGFSEG